MPVVFEIERDYIIGIAVVADETDKIHERANVRISHDRRDFSEDIDRFCLHAHLEACRDAAIQAILRWPVTVLRLRTACRVADGVT
ncbi:hypothetical protein G3N97_22665 [Paraburkholderia sp. Ac-20347]|nr:hypothetical protein [Paraburkholderia sp. Ac-20347]